jgi:UDP-N-acetylglucosamine:LPS N-acetylglucosamine transferase
MGEGHNATGRAVQEAVLRRWPDATITWLDTLDVMGSWVGPTFRKIYVTNVQSTPWLYEFFYAAVWRLRAFARASKRFVGSWCGRRLVPKLREIAPDLIVCTYPLGSAGLDWLRTHRGLDTPVGAWISDFAPHPFWVHSSLDEHFVMHDVALAPAYRAEPEATVRVGAVPVVSRFAPGDRAAAREALELPDHAFVALLTCGAFGFGHIASAVRALLDADESVVPVVACGRNAELRQSVEAIGDPRVRALGWTGRMPELTVAADVVVTNAGGASSLEALACGRAVLMYKPIAAHGRANAELMARAGLADVVHQPEELSQAVARLVREPEVCKGMEKAAATHAAGRWVDEDLRVLARHAALPGGSPVALRPQDATFAQVHSSAVPQQLGFALAFEPGVGNGQRPIRAADVAKLLGAAPGVLGKLRPASTLRRWSWRREPARDLSAFVDEVTCSSLTRAMDEFFSVGLDPVTSPARGRVVYGLPEDRVGVLVAVHHALADGVALALTFTETARREPTPMAYTNQLTAPVKFSSVRRGLATLASDGAARRWKALPAPGDARRHHAVVSLPGPEVRGTAREMGVSTREFLLCALAEGLHHLDPERDGVRVLVPQSLRSTATLRLSGNRTGAARLDLPTGAMSFAERLAALRPALATQLGSHAPAAADWVLRILGTLPPRMHAAASRAVYSGRWFNGIASVIPGPRGRLYLHGARVRDIIPVLPLAPGVGLAVGLMPTQNHVSVSVTTHPDAGDAAERLANAVRDAAVQAIGMPAAAQRGERCG